MSLIEINGKVYLIVCRNMIKLARSLVCGKLYMGAFYGVISVRRYGKSPYLYSRMESIDILGIGCVACFETH